MEGITIFPIVVLITGAIASIITAVFVWKNVDFFISKKDRYLNSGFAILKKKISLVLAAAGAVALLTIIIAGSMVKKEKAKTHVVANPIENHPESVLKKPKKSLKK